MSASDVLSTVFEAAKIRATTSAVQRLQAGTKRRFEGALVHQHRVVSGACELRVEDSDEVLALEEGDFVLLTRSQNHAIDGGGTGDATLVSGTLARSGEAAELLFGLLPPVLHVRGTAARPGRWVDDALTLADHGASPMAREAMWARFAELLFLVGARRVLAELRAPELWASPAFLHPHVGRSMRALHLQPTRKWTVGELARVAGMSRSTFAEAFRRLVGEPPVAYLTRLRVQRAAGLLRAGGSITEVATQAGYATNGAFSKAFKRALGVSPGAYRRATAAARMRTTGVAAGTAAPELRQVPREAASLQAQLARIAHDLEHLMPRALCAIMRFDWRDAALRHGAAPSLPALYCRAIDGVKVGPSAGSCGTAVYRRAPVVVRDTSESALWADYRYLAQRFHLRSCWSKPIFGARGEVLGTFAIYHRDRHEPNEVELALTDHLIERVRPMLQA
ncbi:MAG: helix-turn-helix domain-containing protein [Myxococcota bacterium]